MLFAVPAAGACPMALASAASSRLSLIQHPPTQASPACLCASSKHVGQAATASTPSSLPCLTHSLPTMAIHPPRSQRLPASHSNPAALCTAGHVCCSELYWRRADLPPCSSAPRLPVQVFQPGRPGRRFRAVPRSAGVADDVLAARHAAAGALRRGLQRVPALLRCLPSSCSLRAGCTCGVADASPAAPRCFAPTAAASPTLLADRSTGL